MWDVGLLPFVYAPQTMPSNGQLPELLPFSLDVDKRFGHIIQAHDPSVEAALERAYATSSMLSGMMDDTGIGLKYTEDFLSFVQEYFGVQMDGCSILEIGCGTGYLLSRLQSSGAQVLGIEPGTHGQEGSSRFSVPVVREFFPTPKVPQSFDVIIAFGVLEHIWRFEEFLAAVCSQLKENGTFLLAVPDCEPYLESGDISFLFHEHWNFFTRRSLAGLMRGTFKRDVHVVRSGFGGCLYAVVHMNGPSCNCWIDNVNNGSAAFSAFKKAALTNISLLLDFLRDSTQNSDSLGIYVPGRAVNILGLKSNLIDFDRLRFFDDNPILHNTFYPGIPIRVESRKEFLEKPPGSLLIMTYTFGSAIAASLRQAGFSGKILTWQDLFQFKTARKQSDI